MRALALAVAVLLVAAGDAEARRKRRSRLDPNMPRGWVWPPSRKMKKQGKACLARLDALGVRWRKGARTRGVATPIVLPAMEIGGVRLVPIWRKGPFVMDCHLALAFAEHGAPELRKLGVRDLRFSSIHVYRRVDGTRALSRHALGLAIDVWEVVTDDGTRHVVRECYPAGDALLRDVERVIGGTGGYRLLLTPGNDPKGHDDHFHFEARTPGERVVTPPTP